MLAAIFQDLYHLNDFEKISHGSCFFSKWGHNFLQAKRLHARASHGLFSHSEAVELQPITRDISGHFRMLTQIQHLEKIACRWLAVYSTEP